MNEDELKRLIYEKYPKSPGERKCRIERETMKRLRDNYRKKLLNEYRAAQIIQPEGSAPKEAI